MNNAMRYFRLFTMLVCMVVMFVPCKGVVAQDSDTAHYDDDFVIASLIIADPGDVLYSTVGHAGLHMRCPDHGLDYVFSYESEDARHKVPAFLAGKLRMGMFAIPIQDYLDSYRAEGRGVREYRLNLPIDVKRELWRVLDNHMLEGANLPYDYITYGCAHSALMMIKEALDTIPIEYGEWPQTFEHSTRRELVEQQTGYYPWTRVFLHLIGNGSLDRECSNEDKVIIPADLLYVLQHASVEGQTVIADDAEVLLPSLHQTHRPWCTPLLVSVVILMLTVVSICLKSHVMDYVLLTLQTLLGIVTVYLVVFSSLCCTEWSWLIIPFNPLPLIAWHWRRHWALPYACVLALWIVFIVVWPHTLTDWSYIVLTTSLILSYINIHLSKKNSL